MIHQQQSVAPRRNASSCTVRRFSGPEADELYVLCRPQTLASDGIAEQADSVYRTLRDVLNDAGGDLRHVVHENVFFRDIVSDLTTFRWVRNNRMRDSGCLSCRPASTYIQQPPLDERESLELSAIAVIPHQRSQSIGRSLWTPGPCPCAIPAQFVTRVVGVGMHEYLYAGSIYGADGSAFDEVSSMFNAADDLLRREGLSFRNVVRTWIYLRNIERDYAELNRARHAFFQRSGITLHPASTGIEGAAFPPSHNFSMSFYAIKSATPVDVGLMKTPTLNEAWMYGADFSRGLRVVEANKVALYVSGTASVDEEGRTVHVDDFAGQVDRMLTNVSTLLGAQNASFGDLVTATTYLKSPADAPLFRDILRARGLEGFPNALVKAAVCRPDLLCEMEAIAALPRP